MSPNLRHKGFTANGPTEKELKMISIQIFDANGTMIAEKAVKDYQVGKRISIWAYNI